MEAYGSCGRSGREYGNDRNPSVLAGRLASDAPKVYPDDRCAECEKLGRLVADEKCFRHHWKEKEEAK
jgi:hypothetical protein